MRSSIHGISRSAYNRYIFQAINILRQTKWNTNRSLLCGRPKLAFSNQKALFSLSQSNCASEVIHNSAGYKTAQVPQDYVSAGLKNVDSVNDLINATQTNVEFELVEELDGEVDEIKFFYEDCTDFKRPYIYDEKS